MEDNDRVRVNLRLEQSLREALRAEARREMRSLTAEINWRLQQSLERDGKEFRDLRIT
jgi:hypothetical protein